MFLNHAAFGILEKRASRLVSAKNDFFFLTHYSKSQISQFNFDKNPTFSRVFHPKFFANFLGKLKLNFWTKNEDFEQCDVTVIHIVIVLFRFRMKQIN